MAGKVIEIYDPVSKDREELTDKENKQYQGILNTALDLEEKHKKAREEIQEDYRKFLKRNEQHYKKYKELEAELKEGKITTKDFNSINNLAYNTIQSELIQSKDKLATAESANIKSRCVERPSKYKYKSQLCIQIKDNKSLSVTVA